MIQIKVVGKIDLSNIPKDSKPVNNFEINHPKLPMNRDELDSGWAISFKMIQRNYKRYMLSYVR